MTNLPKDLLLLTAMFHTPKSVEIIFFYTDARQRKSDRGQNRERASSEIQSLLNVTLIFCSDFSSLSCFFLCICMFPVILPLIVSVGTVWNV